MAVVAQTARYNWGQKNIVPTMLIGVLDYYLASYLDMLGLTLITAQLERLILFTYPTMVVVLGALFFHQPILRNIWVALLLTYSGIASIVAHDMSGLGSKVIDGAGLVLVSALCFAMFMLLSKNQIKLIGSRLFTSIAMSAASVAIISHFSLTQSFEQLYVSSNVLLIVSCLRQHVINNRPLLCRIFDGDQGATGSACCVMQPKLQQRRRAKRQTRFVICCEPP